MSARQPLSSSPIRARYHYINSKKSRKIPLATQSRARTLSVIILATVHLAHAREHLYIHPRRPRDFHLGRHRQQKKRSSLCTTVAAARVICRSSSHVARVSHIAIYTHKHIHTHPHTHNERVNKGKTRVVRASANTSAAS